MQVSRLLSRDSHSIALAQAPGFCSFVEKVPVNHVASAAHQLGSDPQGRRVSFDPEPEDPPSWKEANLSFAPCRGTWPPPRGSQCRGCGGCAAAAAPHGLLLWAGCWQIEKDLLRTMPSNACFAHVSGVGVPRLRRVLRALAWLYPEIGYCQGTGMVSIAQGDPSHGQGGWRGTRGVRGPPGAGGGPVLCGVTPTGTASLSRAPRAWRPG